MGFVAPLLSALLLLSVFSHSSSFQSDELINDDDEFIGLDGPTRRRPDLDSAASYDSKAVQFSLDHTIGDSVFSPAVTFTATPQDLEPRRPDTKLRFWRNAVRYRKSSFRKAVERR